MPLRARWRERFTIRTSPRGVDAVNGSAQQPRRTHEWLRHHRRSQRRTNPSRRSGAGSIPARARGSGERHRLGRRCHGCPAPSVGRRAGKHGGVLAAPWSVCGQWNSRNTRNHGTHCEHFRRSEPCSLPGIELLKRVSPVRIWPGAQGVGAGQRRFRRPGSGSGPVLRRAADLLTATACRPTMPGWVPSARGPTLRRFPGPSAGCARCSGARGRHAAGDRS